MIKILALPDGPCARDFVDLKREYDFQDEVIEPSVCSPIGKTARERDFGITHMQKARTGCHESGELRPQQFELLASRAYRIAPRRRQTPLRFRNSARHS